MLRDFQKQIRGKIGRFHGNFKEILHSLDERVFDQQSAREISQWQSF